MSIYDDIYDDYRTLSPAEHEALQIEMDTLHTKTRRELLEEVREERSQEGSQLPYHLSAKWQLEMLDQRIARLRQILERAKVRDYSPDGDYVMLGSLITILNETSNEVTEYTIVGVMEANSAINRISNTSAIARAMLGYKVGDHVKIPDSSGKSIWKIIKVS